MRVAPLDVFRKARHAVDLFALNRRELGNVDEQLLSWLHALLLFLESSV
jgi:hypothetical protein